MMGLIYETHEPQIGCQCPLEFHFSIRIRRETESEHEIASFLSCRLLMFVMEKSRARTQLGCKQLEFTASRTGLTVIASELEGSAKRH